MHNGARPAGGHRVYEEVQPEYRMLPGESFDTLIVDLRAFKNEQQFTKDHLRIQIDNYGNIKVSGERPLGGNRWSRFQKVYRLPEDCNPSGIRATHDNGVLSVVMPKLAKDQPPPPPAAQVQKPPTATQAAAAPAKERAAAAAKAEPEPVAAAIAATVPPEDRKRPTKPAADGKRDAQQAAQEKGKEQVTSAPTDDGRAAAATGKKEPEPAAADAGPTPSPPVPAEKVPAQARKPPPPEEVEKPRFGAAGLDLGALRQRPRRLLLNVVVAVLMLIGLGFYLIYRQRATPDDQEQPGSLSME